MRRVFFLGLIKVMEVQLKGLLYMRASFEMLDSATKQERLYYRSIRSYTSGLPPDLLWSSQYQYNAPLLYNRQRMNNECNYTPLIDCKNIYKNNLG